MTTVALAVACSHGRASSDDDDDEDNVTGSAGTGAVANGAGGMLATSSGGTVSRTAGAVGSEAGAQNQGGAAGTGTAQGGGGGDVPRVTKTNTKQVYAHVMPWFETPQSSGNGKWGIHWTMANQNPDQQDGTGRRQIASHYYPMIGPYASGDADVVEYQLLLMKYSGIDGVLVDWPGTLQKLDYPKNVQNSEAMINRTAAFGLGFAVVYEDQNIKHGEAPDAIGAGKNDMSYLRDRYFNKPNYLQQAGAPLLLVFGPQVFQSPGDWSALLSVFQQRPALFALWGEGKELGEPAAGEYAWVYQDNQHLDDFYGRGIAGTKLGSAYPGFGRSIAKAVGAPIRSRLMRAAIARSPRPWIRRCKPTWKRFSSPPGTTTAKGRCWSRRESSAMAL